jgi:hypothetical protein
VALPRDGGVETLAGFLLMRLGKIPRGGESIVFENRQMTVTEMDGRRIKQIRVEPVEEWGIATARHRSNKVKNLGLWGLVLLAHRLDRVKTQIVHRSGWKFTIRTESCLHGIGEVALSPGNLKFNRAVRVFQDRHHAPVGVIKLERELQTVQRMIFDIGENFFPCAAMRQ